MKQNFTSQLLHNIQMCSIHQCEIIYNFIRQSRQDMKRTHCDFHYDLFFPYHFFNYFSLLLSPFFIIANEMTIF